MWRTAPSSESPVRPSGLGRLAGRVHRPGGHHKARTCDQLTGLLDRSALDDEFPILVRRARSGHTHVALLSCDIDCFGRVNAEFGRARGDSVLVAFSARVCETLRATENAFRWGGEQFVIAAYGHDEAEARGLAEHLQATIASRPVGGVDLTVSIGVAVGHDRGDEAGALAQAADAALRQAKRMGRGRIVVADWSANVVAAANAAPAPGFLAPLPAR